MSSELSSFSRDSERHLFPDRPRLGALFVSTSAESPSSSSFRWLRRARISCPLRSCSGVSLMGRPSPVAKRLGSASTMLCAFFMLDALTETFFPPAVLNRDSSTRSLAEASEGLPSLLVAILLLASSSPFLLIITGLPLAEVKRPLAILSPVSPGGTAGVGSEGIG